MINKFNNLFIATQSGILERNLRALMLGKPLKAIVIIICLIHTCYKANTGM